MADGQLPLNLDRCYHCGAPATLLCDGVLGLRRTWYAPPSPDVGAYIRDVGRWVIDTDHPDAFVTCDRLLCSDCATLAGVTHVCGSGGCHRETRDLCRDCVDLPASAPPLLSDEEATALRRRRLLHA